jgi:tetratricopeptide (TPR) repeat protein
MIATTKSHTFSQTVGNVLSINFANGKVLLGDSVVTSLPRWFQLYAFLAFRQFGDTPWNQGSVSADQIAQLSLWIRNSPGSVGKQILRHAQSLSSRHISIIEMTQKTKGPYRLKIAKANIHSDLSWDEVALRLGVFDPPFDAISEPISIGSFVEAQWKGLHAFYDCKLAASLKLYEAALSAASLPQHRVLAIYNLGRVLDRQGGQADAWRLHAQAVKAASEAGRYRLWAETKCHVMAGWLFFRERKLDGAEKEYHQALLLLQGSAHFQLLGDIYNGVGLIEKRRQKHRRALQFFDSAMNNWVQADYYYGLQAVYFNIAILYAQP